MRSFAKKVTRAPRLAGLVIPALLCVSVRLSASSGSDRASASSPACVEAWGEAPYRGAGYDHIVHVRNSCEKAVLCAVSTNVNPDPQNVTVPSRGEVEVLTFRGSPARVFTPKVDCKLLL